MQRVSSSLQPSGVSHTLGQTNLIGNQIETSNGIDVAPAL